MLKRMNQILPLFLVAVLFAATAAPALAMKPERTTIVDVALDVNAESGEFAILIQALLAADPAVIETLAGNGQFTVFAPTDAAFVALLGELGLSAEQLLAEKELVTQVLLYHVLNGRRDSTDILGSDRLRTLERSFLFQNGGILTDANGRTANIIATDIEADNGIIHVIDQVVLP
jgi:uncharacterized surface protein with fasciclin (FAS1) repeats